LYRAHYFWAMLAPDFSPQLQNCPCRGDNRLCSLPVRVML